MKVIFIVGAIEPGRDGVGDYSRRLAGSIRMKGHDVALVSINDKYISSSIEENQYSDGVALPVLRITSQLNSSERFSIAQKYVDSFSPDWLSIQFVPYAFHPKGLPFGLIRYLGLLSRRRKIHIMFHELWVGLYGETSFKNRIVGQIQKLIIATLQERLRPDLITTSIPIYKKNLKSANKLILPLFSNIPVVSHLDLELNRNSKEVIAIHFGSFSSSLKEFREQLVHLVTIAKTMDKSLRLLVMGEGGPFKSRALEVALEICGSKSVSDLGKLPFEEISKNMQQADVGISRADFVMFGKSGSTIAMLEHGLPVLLRGKRPLDHKYEKFEEFEEQLLFFGDEFKPLPIRKKPVSQVEKVSSVLTERFLSLSVV